LRDRTHEIERILARCTEAIDTLAVKVKHLSQELAEARAGCGKISFTRNSYTKKLGI
jgi:hypothetical protein